MLTNSSLRFSDLLIYLNEKYRSNTPPIITRLLFANGYCWKNTAAPNKAAVAHNNIPTPHATAQARPVR
jgi:hypothetical protein